MSLDKKAYAHKTPLKEDRKEDVRQESHEIIYPLSNGYEYLMENLRRYRKIKISMR